MKSLALLLLGVLASSAFGQALTNRRAPSFSLPDAGYNQHDILDYRGRWLLLDFMMTNCPHCQALTKVLESKKKAFTGKADILSIVLPPDNPTTVAKYVSDYKVTSPIVFDSGVVAMAYFKANAQSHGFDTPHLFAIDPNGNVVRDWSQTAVETATFPAELDQLVLGKK